MVVSVHRSHWTVVAMGVVPDQLPTVVVSGRPVEDVPLTTGRAVEDGATAGAGAGSVPNALVARCPQ